MNGKRSLLFLLIAGGIMATVISFPQNQVPEKLSFREKRVIIGPPGGIGGPNTTSTTQIPFEQAKCTTSGYIRHPLVMQYYFKCQWNTENQVWVRTQHKCPIYAPIFDTNLLMCK